MSLGVVFLLGAGAVGRAAANYIALCPGVRKLVVAAPNLSKAYSTAINAQMGAMHFGRFPKVESISLNLHDEEYTKQVITNYEPDVILNAATMISTSFYYPLIQRRMEEIGFEHYCPHHNLVKDLILVYKLMKAVRKSGVDTKSVSVASPDNAHPVLAKVGLTPTVGAGNVDILAQGVRKVVADKLGVPIHNISVTLIGNHALNYWTSPENTPSYLRGKMTKIPYYLRIWMNGVNLTKKFGTDKLIMTANDMTATQGYNWEQMAAASAVKQSLSILNDEGRLFHGTGVNGVPGCAPVRLNAKGSEIVLPEDITLDEVIEICEAGMRWTGTEKIEPDGTVVFTEETIKLMRDVLNLEWEKMRISEMEEMVKDLISAYTKLKH